MRHKLMRKPTMIGTNYQSLRSIRRQLRHEYRWVNWLYRQHETLDRIADIVSLMSGLSTDGMEAEDYPGSYWLPLEYIGRSRKAHTARADLERILRTLNCKKFGCFEVRECLGNSSYGRYWCTVSLSGFELRVSLDVPWNEE